MKRRKSRMSLRTAICNLLSHAVAFCDKANKVRDQKKVQFNQSAKKVVTNDSIGTFSPGLYILYFLKLPAPPPADLSGIVVYMHIQYIFSLHFLEHLEHLHGF